MKLKKLLAGFVSAAMIMGTMMLPAFADDETVELDVGEGRTYSTFEEARDAVDENANSITYVIYGKVVMPEGEVRDVVGRAKKAQTVTFKAADDDTAAEIALESTSNNMMGRLEPSIDVNYENLKLSRANGKYVYDLGEMNHYFTTSSHEKTVTYTGCSFPNGTCNNQYGKTVYNNCNFTASNGGYGLWIYAYNLNGNPTGQVEVTGGTVEGNRGVKTYSMGQDNEADITVTGTKFKVVNEGKSKPAIMLSQTGKITLNDIDTTECTTAVIAAEVADGGARTNKSLAEVTINGEKKTYVAAANSKFYTTVEDAKTDGATEENIKSVAAKIDNVYYTSLEDAVKAAKSGDTITLLDDISINTKGFSAEGTSAEPKDNITLDGNNKKITCNVEATAMNFKNFNNFTIKNLTLEGKARYGIILNMGKNKTLENVKISGDYLFSFMALNMGGTTFKNCDLSNINTGKIKSDTVSEYVAGSVWTNVDTANGTEMLSLISSKIDGITVNGYKEGYNPIIPKILVDENSETKVYTIENTYINEATPKSKLYCLSPESKGNVTVQEVTYNGDNVADISDVIVPVAVVDGKYFDNMDEAKKAAGESGAVNPYEPASTVKVSFSPAGITENDEALYDLYIETGDSALINRLTSAELTFALTTTDDINYEVSGADNVTVTPDNTAAGKYGFNFDGINKADETGTKIKLAQIKFSGYGKFNFEITGDKNAVNATEIADNIVTTYIANPTKENEGKFNTEAKLENIEIKKPVKTLTVNIDFPNAVEDNAKEYQNMKVVISGGDMTADKEIALGSGSVDMADGKYKVSEDLTKDMAYTVKVSGAGYRTARYTVTMTGDKVLNFWNNAKDADTVVEEGNANSARKVTFLAGDIVKDNNINVYDLSAVVSYFGTKVDKDTQAEYAKYDLNRDGVIDSKDVAYVLVSWGK